MKDVVIVGAGPVGIFAALLLQQRGLSVDLYEKLPRFILCLAPAASTTKSFASFRVWV